MSLTKIAWRAAASFDLIDAEKVSNNPCPACLSSCAVGCAKPGVSVGAAFPPQATNKVSRVMESVTIAIDCFIVLVLFPF
jgi:hypothetical protein